MKPIQQYKDPRITNLSFDNFTGSVYIIADDDDDDENKKDSMLTSPRTNGVDNFVPSHHLALITQPVLGARSRKKPTNIIVETSTKDKFDSMSNSRRSSYNDSPPLTFPINRVDPSQYQKKTNSNSHHESSDSGLDLSLSTNSSVQYPLQHITIHRPLSALNEDSNPDDGYHEEHQQAPNKDVRLRFPPVNLGRNRSMEDMINNNTHEQQQQQHRSSSFSDERLQNLSLKQEQKMKRSSDGAILDLLDTSPQIMTELHRHKNDSLYLSPTQQHRSLNDLTNKPSNRVLSIRNESNINNLPTTQTIIRKPTTSTLKPLRKKTKLNIIVESSLPLTSSRLAVYDEQINTMTGTNSSSSNQTTPRSIRPLVQPQQQIKPKATTPLGYYPNQEQMRAHVNRSVVERQHPPTSFIPPRRGLMQQIIPFDASPSKVNNLLLRHHHHHPPAIFHPSSNIHGGGIDIPITHNSQLSPSRPKKQVLPVLYTEETISSIPEGKRKQKEQIKIEKLKEQEEKKQRFKQKEEIENHQKGQIRIKVKDIQQPIQSKFGQKHEDSQDQNEHRHFLTSIPKHRFQQEDGEIEQRQQIENILKSTPRNQYEHNRQRQSLINDSNRNTGNDRYGSGQSINPISKPQDGINVNRRQQRNEIFPGDRSDGTKPTGLIHRNNINDKILSRAAEPNSQLGPDYSYGTQRNTLVNLQARASKAQFQTYGTPIVQSQAEQNRTWQNSKYGNDHQSWQKSQGGSTSKNTRIEPLLSTNSNMSDLRRERETSRLSNISKTESTQTDERQFKQTKMIEKTSIGGCFQSKSPTSWSVISEHQNDQKQFDTYEQTSNHQSQSSTSSSSRQESIREKSGTPSRTYRLMITEEQEPQDGRYVMPNNNSQISTFVDPSHTSSRHTLPFTCTPDSDINDSIVVDDSTSQQIRNKEQKSIVADVYTLSDRDSSQNTIDRLHSPSPLVHLSSNKKFHSPPPINGTISTENDEIISNYDSDDGWSDDSAELLYVDERYATQKKKINSSSHLPTQQHYHYKVQQQNVLLQ